MEVAGAGEVPAVDPPADVDDEVPDAEDPAPLVGGPDSEGGGPVEGPEEGPDEGPLLVVLPVIKLD